MNFQTEIDTQLLALHKHDDFHRWRTILTRAVLDMLKPARVLAAIRSIDPNSFPKKTRQLASPESTTTGVRRGGDAAALTAVRRMLEKTRVQMGLPSELPVSPSRNSKGGKSGKPTDEQLEEFRIINCIPWMEKNGGYPRMDQLTDPAWDLLPFPPKAVISPPEPTERTSPKPSVANDQDNVNSASAQHTYVESTADKKGDGEKGMTNTVSVPRDKNQKDIAKDLRSGRTKTPGAENKTSSSKVREQVKKPSQGVDNIVGKIKTSKEKQVDETNGILLSVSLTKELDALPVNKFYPTKSLCLKNEIFRLSQNGCKPTFSTRSEWRREINEKMEHAGIKWDEGSLGAI